MRLQFYQEEINFGDALNPYIFNSLLPGFFDQKKDVDFFGIGSIIGCDMMKNSEAKKKIIFSSGLGYSEPPIIDSTYDILCVRGPLTAKELKIDNKYVITDGATLVSKIYTEICPKKYACSFMPHHRSEKIFDWKNICKQVGINYISPCGDPLQGLKEINESRLIIAEAMHGAIIADALRVPWIPIKIYEHINTFKWKDWMSSLDMDYEFTELPRIFKKSLIDQKIKKHMMTCFLPKQYREALSEGFYDYQIKNTYPKILEFLEKLSRRRGYISRDIILAEKIQKLLDKLDYMQEKYKK